MVGILAVRVVSMSPRVLLLMVLLGALSACSKGTSGGAGKVDLELAALAVDGQCQATISLVNKGTDSLLPSAYGDNGPVVTFSFDGTAVGSWSLAELDPSRSLAAPGGELEWARPGALAGRGSLSATFDPQRTLTESDELNNTVSADARCEPRVLDIAVSAEIGPDCEPVLTLDNIGTVEIPAQAYRRGVGAYFQRFVDDEPADKGFLGVLDRERNLVSPGSTHNYIDKAAELGQKTLAYELRGIVGEDKLDNNRVVVDVAENCRGETEQPADLQVARIGLDASCNIEVELANRGPGRIPQRAYDAGHGATLSLRKEGKSIGAWRLRGIDPEWALSDKGGSLTWVSKTPLSGRAEVTAEIDRAGIITDKRRANNELSKTLVCQR